MSFKTRVLADGQDRQDLQGGNFKPEPVRDLPQAPSGSPEPQLSQAPAAAPAGIDFGALGALAQALGVGLSMPAPAGPQQGVPCPCKHSVDPDPLTGMTYFLVKNSNSALLHLWRVGATACGDLVHWMTFACSLEVAGGSRSC